MDKEIIILAIKPNYAQKILDNMKTVELRRICPKKIGNGSLVLMYVSSPIQSLLGAFIVEKVVEAPLDELWQEVKKVAGVSKNEFDDYFINKDNGVGIFINSIHKFSKPIDLNEIQTIWSDFVPPQGFRYASAKKLAFPEVLSLA